MIYENVNSIESLFIELINEKQKNVVIGTVYNPPGNKIELFSEYIVNAICNCF